MNSSTDATIRLVDFSEVVDQSLRAKPPRGDEAFAHISDLYGCDRATWARRRGLPQLPFEPRTLVKFEMGHAIEETVSRAIREHYPGDSLRNVQVAWNPTSGQCIALGNDGPGAIPDDTFLVGHIDIDLDNDTLIEVKSTVFFKGREPSEAESHYIEQAAGYATATKKRAFAIVVVCRSTGKVLTFWFNTADYFEWATKRALEVLANTDPSIPIEPEANPRTSWQCKTCNHGACSRNENPAKEAVHV